MVNLVDSGQLSALFPYHLCGEGIDDEASMIIEAEANYSPRSRAAPPFYNSSSSSSSSTINNQDQALFDAMAQAACNQMGGFNAQDIADTAWAFATLGHGAEQAPALFGELAAEACEQMGSFQEQRVADIAWAFTKAGHVDQALSDAMFQRASESESAFSAKTRRAISSYGLLASHYSGSASY